MSRLGLEARFALEQTIFDRTNVSMTISTFFEGFALYSLNQSSPDYAGVAYGATAALIGVYAWADALRSSLPPSVTFNIREISRKFARRINSGQSTL